MQLLIREWCIGAIARGLQELTGAFPPPVVQYGSRAAERQLEKRHVLITSTVTDVSR